MERRGRILWGDLKQCRVDLFDEIVAKLVQPINVVLHLDDCYVSDIRVARTVLAVP